MTAASRGAYVRVLATFAELARRRAERPLDYVRWLTPQDRWLRLPGDKLYRAGNQALGKSTAGLAEVIWRSLGVHPHYPTRPPPIETLICSLNQSQSISIQGKFAALLPKDCLAPGCEYNEKTGYGANRPTTIFRNGSVIRWITDDQGPRAAAGRTVDVVLVDEPCSPEMMRELRKRLLTAGAAGVLLATLTPINGPVQHIRESVDKGLIPEVHAALTLENLRHADTGEVRHLEDGTLCDEAWIAEMWRREPPSWAGITLDGLWEVRPEGAFFAPVWDSSKHISARARLDGETRWHLGIDYAAADRPQGLVAVLVLVEPGRTIGGHAVESMIVEDLCALPGTATITMFAQDILRMLARNGLTWRNLHGVYGDNPVQGAIEWKGNTDLTKRLAHEMRINPSALSPRIMSAKERTSGGSRDTGCRYLYEALADCRLVMRARCSTLAEAIETWDYTAMHQAKDRIDALRYALKDYILPSGRSPAVVVRFG